MIGEGIDLSIFESGEDLQDQKIEKTYSENEEAELALR